VASERIGEVLDVDVGVLHATTIGEKSPENPA